jgi:hypothetical protein
MANHKFYGNLIALCVGLILFGTDLFSQFPSLDRIGITFFGGYLAVSVYHAWIFGSERMANMYSAIVFWLMPVVFAFSVVFCLLYGLIVSVPKFLYSMFQWLMYRRSKRVVAAPKQSPVRSTFPTSSRRANSNVVQIRQK